MFSPIGYFYNSAHYKFEVPRQGVFFRGHLGKIELLPQKDFEIALRDLEGFERIWVIFQFHQNAEWRPTTRPPVPAAGKERVGTFASRSPYRPNPIGLSCVRLISVNGLTLTIDEADLLSETPILDIKPYSPKADAFPRAKAGWVDLQNIDPWEISATEEFLVQSRWIESVCGWDLKSFAECQLNNSPLDSSRRRVKVHENQIAELAFRTFRIDFSFDEKNKKICLQKIRSGYIADELNSAEDIYSDKALHREFLAHFAQTPNA